MSTAQTSARRALSVPQVTSETGIGRNAVYAAIKSGELPALRVGRKVLVRPDAVEAWLSALEQR